MKKILLILLALLTLLIFLMPIGATRMSVADISKKDDIVVGFSKNNNIVSDATTGLQWQDDGISLGGKAWYDAIDYCEGLVVDTYEDWRLPSKNELKSIIKKVQYNRALAKEFTHFIPYAYWSSTSYKLNNDYAWFIDFKYGYGGENNKDDYKYVRCVRQ